MKINLSIALTSVLIVSATTLLAQTAPVQQVESTTRIQEQQQRLMQYETGQSAPELYSGENEDLGPQRILKLKPHHNYFEGYVDSQFFYTSNGRLSSNNEEETTLFVNTVDAAFVPPLYKILNHDFETRVGVRAQWYNYGLGRVGESLSDFDFFANTAYLEENFSPAENWVLGFGAEALQIRNQPSYHRFYEEIAPKWKATRFFPISQNKMFTASYIGYYRFTDQDTSAVTFASVPKDLNNRTDHMLTLSYIQGLTPKLFVQPYYQFQYTRFTETGSRNEYTHTVGLSLVYNLCENASLRAFGNFETRSTDDTTFGTEYDKYDAGLGINLNVKF